MDENKKPPFEFVSTPGALTHIEPEVWQPPELTWYKISERAWIARDPDGADQARVWAAAIAGAGPGWYGQARTTRDSSTSHTSRTTVMERLGDYWHEEQIRRHYTTPLHPEPARGRDGLSVTQWQFQRIYRAAVRRGVQASSDLAEYGTTIRRMLESEHPEYVSASDVQRLHFAYQKLGESLERLDVLGELAMKDTDDIDLLSTIRKDLVMPEPAPHTWSPEDGLHEHDGLAPHSHAVRPDHKGIEQTS